MKVALIGATGFVGKAILQELLDRGHTVTAISRNPGKAAIQDPGKIAIPNPHLIAKAGNVLEPDEVTNLVKGHDAVISAYNPGWANPKIGEEFLEGSQAIEAGVKKSGVKRLIVIGGAGSLEVAPGKQLVDSPQFPAEYKVAASAARDYLNILKKDTVLEWTFFSPAILMNHDTSGVRKGVYRAGLDNPVFDKDGKSVLSVEDLAVAIVDELEHPKYIRKRFTAAY
jgi:putative NADH-flavin reductase